MKSTNGVTHWVDGEKTLTLGFSGLIIQIRSYVFQVVLAIPLMGVPFWWPEKWPNAISVSPTTLIWQATAVLLLFGISGSFYLRLRITRSLRIKSNLHQLSHLLRDSLSETFKNAGGRKSKTPNPIRFEQHRKQLRSTSDRAATLVAEYFKCLTGDPSVGCAIRLAEDRATDGLDQIKYVTVGRSDGLNCNREKTSQGIPRNSGIPHFFLSQPSCQGVLFYDDLTKATAAGAYLRTTNDQLFGGDFSSMAVAPINGWNGAKKDLIGLLCITSKTGKVLRVHQVDSFKFKADVLANFYISFISKLQSVGQMPSLTEISEES